VLAKLKGPGGHGCPAAMAALLGRTPPSTRHREDAVSVVAVRTSGDRAFVLYRNPLTPHATISMLREDGRWTAGVISAIPSG
jgi:hypothetical protein